MATAPVPSPRGRGGDRGPGGPGGQQGGKKKFFYRRKRVCNRKHGFAVLRPPNARHWQSDSTEASAPSSAAAASIIGVNTLLLSADTAQPADVIALAAMPTQDGVLRLPGTSQARAFAVATVNLGIAALVTVMVDWGI